MCEACTSGIFGGDNLKPVVETLAYNDHGTVLAYVRPVAMTFLSNSNSNFEFESKRGIGRNDSQLKLSSQSLRWRWGAACSVPRVSDIDDACSISTHHMFLSNCVVQVMRVWSLAAVLSLLAKHDHVSTIRRGEGALPGSAQIHVASI